MNNHICKYKHANLKYKPLTGRQTEGTAKQKRERERENKKWKKMRDQLETTKENDEEMKTKFV